MLIEQEPEVALSLRKQRSHFKKLSKLSSELKQQIILEEPESSSIISSSTSEKSFSNAFSTSEISEVAANDGVSIPRLYAVKLIMEAFSELCATLQKDSVRESDESSYVDTEDSGSARHFATLSQDSDEDHQQNADMQKTPENSFSQKQLLFPHQLKENEGISSTHREPSYLISCEKFDSTAYDSKHAAWNHLKETAARSIVKAMSLLQETNSADKETKQLFNQKGQFFTNLLTLLSAVA